MKYSVVIPCYNSSKTIRKVVEQTGEELTRLGITDFEFVLVNDCSPDDRATYKEICAICEDYPDVTGIDLAKNAGQHNAIMAGLHIADGDFVIGMDDDMQTHPSQIGIMLDELEKGYDIVYGYYPEKKHSPFRNFGSWVNYITVRIMIGKPKWLKTSSFWIIRKYVRDEVIRYDQPYAYMQGLFLRTTRNIACVPVKHYKREVGKSNYTFKKLLKLWSNIMCFSDMPLKISTYLGFFFSIAGLIMALVVVIRKLVNPALAMGWASTISAISFFGGLNLFFTGMVGEYVGRMFLGTNKTPQYVVREITKKEAKD